MLKRWAAACGLALITAMVSQNAWAQASACKLSAFTRALESTGTGPFTGGTCTAGGTTHAAGSDACDTDSVVRTNDSYIYAFNYSIGPGVKEDNVTFTSTLPQVAAKTVVVWDGLPAQCKTTGVTPVSSVSADGRTLVCNIGTVDRTGLGGITSGLLASVKTTVLGANGNQVIAPVSLSSTNCSGAAQPANFRNQATPVVEISARQKADFRKDGVAEVRPTTFGGAAGYIVRYYVYTDQYDSVTGTFDAKGGESLNSPVSFQDTPTNFPAGSKWVGCGKFDGQGTISCAPASGTLLSATPNGTITWTANAGEAGQFLVGGGVNTTGLSNTSIPQRLNTGYLEIFVPVASFTGQVNLSNNINTFVGTTASNAAVVDSKTDDNTTNYTLVKVSNGYAYKYVAKSWGDSWARYPYGSAPAGGDVFVDGGDINYGDSGTGLVFPGQVFYPMLRVYNGDATPQTNVILCDTFDNTKSRVKDIGSVLPGKAGQAVAFRYEQVAGQAAAAFPLGYTAEYASVPNPPTGSSECKDTDATWFLTIAAAGGPNVINKVRIKIPQLASGFQSEMVIAHEAVASNPNGTVIPDYYSFVVAERNNGNWTDSSYNPVDNANVSLGKRVTLTTAIARVQKDTVSGTTQANAGGVVDYKITPSLSTILPSPPATSVKLVDTLPAPLTYVANSASVPPDSVAVDAAGNTTLTWTLNNVTPNANLTPITFQATVPQVIAGGAQVTNKVVISSPADGSLEAQRTANKTINIVNPPGVYVFKSTPTPVIEPNGTGKYKLQIANFRNTPTDVDVIDILPFVGDDVTRPNGELGRNPKTNFAGTRGLAAQPTGAPTSTTYYYTSRAPSAIASDPGDPSNTPLAAPNWCTQAQFGSAGCPTSFVQATAFRVQIPAVAGGGVAELNFDLATNGNAAGNVYTNRFFAKPSSTGLTVQSNDVPITVALGSIAGKVYRDDNSNATQQSPAEPGIAGVTVTLCKVAPTGTPLVCPAGNTVGTPQVTDAGGNYKFPNLPSSTYYVVETQPAGYLDAPANAPGSAGGTASSPNAFIGITLAVGANATNYNFGELGAPAIGTRKALNTAATPVAGQPGAYDVPFRVAVKNFGTSGLGNVTLTDTVCGAGGAFAVSTTCTIQSAPVVTVTGAGTTAATAGAAYTGLAAGNNLLALGAVLEVGGEITADFTVRVTFSTSYAFNNQATGTGTPTSGGATISDLSNNGASYTGGTDTSPTGTNSNAPTPVQFAVLQGRVFADPNNNGTPDAGEAGLTGTTVTVTGGGLTAAYPVTTDVNGNYFAIVPVSTTPYVITETQPAGYQDGRDAVGTGALSASAAAGAPLSNPAAGAGSGVADTGTGNGIGADRYSGVLASTPGSIYGNFNFGENQGAPVSGRIYWDTAANAANDGTTTDPGVGGVALTLCKINESPCTVGNTVATTTSAADGTYTFPSVEPGSYFVVETQPPSYGSSTANVIPVTRTGITPATDLDFGETRGQIAGYVYNDVDGSGVRNAGDTGIGSITVTLTGTDANNQPVNLTATTQPDGSYLINNIPVPLAGTTYTLTETPGVPTTGGYTNGSTNVGTPNFGAGSTNTAPGTANSPGSVITGIGFTPPSTPVLARPISGTDYNFGELLQGAVTGRVYVDTNTNGINDGATTDPGVNGVTLTLCRVATVPCPPASVVATTTSAADGTYTFPNVPAGSYFVQETQPGQYGSSTANVLPVTRSGNGNVANVDFGETPARVSGRVYQDVNVNGTFDTGDKGIVGVTVRLTGTDAAGNAVTLTATTLADGTYSFPNVPAPNATGYTITEDQTTVPTGLFNGTTNVGTITPNGGAATASGTANNASSTITGLTWTPPAAVTAAPQAIGQNYNFGEVQGANISGTVIRDTSRNGTVDPNEPGITGVTVALCRTNNVPCPAGDTVSTVVTATDGTYSFPMVPAGNYFVVETQPNTLGDSPGSPNARPVTVATTDVTNVNFLDMPAELSGAVYRDNNNNGLRDAGEPGIAGISVRLTGTDIAGNPVTLTTTTDASGNYIFRDLPAAGPAGYTVVEASQPAQTADSAANPGALANAAGAPVTVGVGTAADRNTLGGIVLPPGGVGTNYLFGDVPSTAGVSGTVWRDNDHDRRLSPSESVVPGWTVQLIRTDAAGNNPVVVGTAITDANGRYSFTNLPPGPNYQIVFRSPDARDANGQPALYGTPVNGEQGTGTAPIPPTITGGIVQRITLVADTTVIQQSLPLDPGGVVYDSITRLPVAGAQVTIQGPAGFNPAIHLVGGAANATQTVGTTGEYQFLLLPTAPAGNYTLSVVPPTGYTFTSALIPPTGGALTPAGPAGGVVQVVPRSVPPIPGSADPTTYYLSFNLTPGLSPNVVNNHIPLDPAVQPKLAISKTGDRSQVEIGDSLRYTVTVRRTDSGAGNLPSFAVTDTLPAGFRYIPGTLTINGTPVADTQAGLNTVGPALPILVNFGAPPLNATGTTGLAAGATVTINYRVRVGVGAAEGTGINRAQARINPGVSCATSPALCSNEAQYKVTVTGGVFTKQACIVGKVYIDCNNNQVQDAEELGIPGVRLYLNDGTFVISDSEGKYSLCDLAPRTWVLKADNLTLPKGSRLVTSSSRNVGDAGSLFLDLKNGDLMRADFIEGSCSNTVLEEAKARRTQGEIHTPSAGATQTEKKSGNVLKFKGKAPGYAPEGTDSADQPLVKPRTPGGKPDSGQPKSELNTPVPQQKDAFSGSTTSDEDAQKGAGK